jgi:hypothetical protein
MLEQRGLLVEITHSTMLTPFAASLITDSDDPMLLLKPKRINEKSPPISEGFSL